VPQIIRARLYDQPDNGDRVTRLGVRSLLPENDSCDLLVAAAKHLASDPEVQRQLDHFRTQIAGSDSIACAASVIERLVANGTPARQRRAG
jgi:UDP:flavonoid glycosyltransferase YjiC (YdhE family)